PEYLDVTVPPNGEFVHATKEGHTAFAYVIGGEGRFCEETNPFAYETEGANYFDMQRRTLIDDHSLVVFEDGEQVRVSAEEKGVRFLFVSGKPIGEPVAWYGPVVMNTQEELRIAFEEYGNGTFIKQKGKG